MSLYKLLLVCIVALFVVSQSNAEEMKTIDGDPAFYFDAIVVKGHNPDSARVDCYLMVPYQSLNFNKIDANYSAKYQAVISVFDSLGNKIASDSRSKSLLEKDYAISQGSTGQFDISQMTLLLPPGNYKIKATLIDEFSRQEYFQSRTISIIDYDMFPLSMSAILLLSAIEEVNGKYKITPHISDNIANLRDGFFAFFEVYNQFQDQEIDFLYQIFEGDKLLEKGQRIRKTISNGTNRVFIRINKPKTLGNAGFVLRLLALAPADGENYAETDIKAVAQRSIKSITKLGGVVLADLPKSIRQLRYVANQNDIEHIQAGESDNEKIARFEEFWKSLDPTPTTERNEAFDEYYRRIAFATKNYKSYTDGWLTDKGMVYIVFGQPMNVERINPYNDGRIYERWLYQGNREFIFGDNSGFGDYRLVRPITVVEKYRYENK